MIHWLMRSRAEGPTHRNMTFIRELTEAEYEEYKVHEARLLRFSSDVELLIMLERNCVDLLTYIRRFPGVWIRQGGFRREAVSDFILDVNRYFLNVLSMMRTNLDHSEQFMRHRYGMDSTEPASFKAACAAEYDGNFAYRFFYGLRNYGQHRSRPITHMRVRAEADRPGPEAKIEATLELLFNRDALLADSGWKSVLREEIKRLPEEFPVLPYLHEMMQCMRRVWQAVLRTASDEARSSADYVQALATEGIETGGAPYIMVAAEPPPHAVPGGPPVKWRSDANFLPMQTVRLVRRLCGHDAIGSGQ